ncbi:MAG: ABC transporter permease [Chloroflexota bacterium]
MKKFDTRRYPGIGPMAWFTFIFLYLPLLVVIFYSFNSSEILSRWGGFSLAWYGEALSRDDIRSALTVSLQVAVIAMMGSVTLATMAALGLLAMARRGSSAALTVIGLPLVIPEIVTAVATLSFFGLIGLNRGLFTLILAHTAFCIPFAFFPIRARLSNIDVAIFEAGIDLGASKWRLFRRVILPLLFPGIVSGALLAFIISLDDYIISSFVAGPQSATLPLFLFGLIRRGASPLINALSTLLLLLTFVILIVSYLVSNRRR